jgi:hypothetical protein
MLSFHATLKALCLAKTAEVFEVLTKLGFEVVYNHRGKRYAYRPGVSSTSPLVVCHADTVVNGGSGIHNYAVEGDKVVSIALDDRLGIACMVDAITANKPLAACAMLVCDDEEIGQSTASLLDTTDEPNWMVELDRRGTEVVSYQYETPLLNSLLRSVGFKTGYGSFSDICSLEHLGVVGFNVGVGYHNEHSEACHANLQDTFAQLGRLDKFLAKFGDVRLDHESDDFGNDDRYEPLQYNDRYEPIRRDDKFLPFYNDFTDNDLLDCDSYWKE